MSDAIKIIRREIEARKAFPGEYDPDITRAMETLVRPLTDQPTMTSAQMVELLPCPFCGSTDIDAAFAKWGDGAVSPGCMECGATAETRNDWNTRASPLAPPEGGMREALNKLAAECHRAKWEFDYNEEDPPTRAASHDLVKSAFRTLARIGDMALMMHATDRALSPPVSPAGEGGMREAMEQIIAADQREKSFTIECDPAGNTMGIEVVDGPCATIARAFLSAAQSSGEAEPLAYACFTDSGNIRLWSTTHAEIEAWANTVGRTVTPLYAAPPAAPPVADVRAATIEERAKAFQRKLDASVTAEQATEYVRKERERRLNEGRPYPAPKDGFINDYD